MASLNALDALKTARSEFEKLVGEIRPELHRYCTRMTGSAIDGEDIVQDTLAKAFYLLPQTAEIGNLRSWIFRIAHNKAVDFTRRYERRFGEPLDDRFDLAAETPPVESRELTRMGLALFMKLTPVQRGAVILKDVLGHSLTEIAETLDTTVPAVKGALNRGRASLRRLGQTAVGAASPLNHTEVNLLDNYVRHFAAREFDKLRELLAQDVRLDLVGMAQSAGAPQVGQYFHRYSATADWRPQAGFVEGRPAILMFDPRDESERPVYFILIEWENGAVVRIHDYRYARYVIAEAAIEISDRV